MDWERIGCGAADLLTRLIQVPTVSGWGRETEAARFLAAQAEACGLSAQVYEPVPGCGSFVATLRGQSAESLLLLSHLDVAPPGREADWRYPPFGGVLREGAVWGRGAVDAKGLAITWLMVMRLMAAQPARKYGLVMVATAGEEGGTHNGLRWLMEHEYLRHCRWALGEGGGTPIPAGRSQVVLIQTAEKGVLRARLPVGYDSKTRSRKIRAQSGLAYEALKTGLAVAHGYPEWAARFLPDGMLAGSTRYGIDLPDQKAHTWEITKERVLTCRVCPGSTTTQVIGRIAPLLGVEPEHIEILEQVEPTASELSGPLYEILQREVSAFYGGAKAGPFCTPGYSDNRFARSSGIQTFGFFPLPAEELVGQHQPNEHITTASLRRAIRLLYNVTQRFCV